MGSKPIAIAMQAGRTSFHDAARKVVDDYWDRKAFYQLAGIKHDVLEQIRGAHVDPSHAERVEAALSVLLSHRADCGFYPGQVPGLEWMQLAGFIERRNSTLGRPPNRMATRWLWERQ